MRTLAAFITASLVLTVPASAKSPGHSSGKNLLQAPSARSSAMGDTFVARPNDIASFGYNPAMLPTLESGQASLMYHRGLVDDSYSHLMFGRPIKKGAVGFALGYYDGGSIDLNDGTQTRSVKAQTDLMASVGYGIRALGIEWGATGKYFRSELGEFSSANAILADVGASKQIAPRLRIGGAYQNAGTTLRYSKDSDRLPEILRLGLSYSQPIGRTVNTLTFDMPRYVGDSEFRPAVGVESALGPIALRAGYKSQIELSEFSMGIGLKINQLFLDYAFGYVNDLNEAHRISLSYAFKNAPPKEITLRTEEHRIVEMDNVVTSTVTAMPTTDEIERYASLPVHFASGSDEISNDYKPNLDAVAEFLRKNPRLKLFLYGHTDNRGNPDFNHKLSWRRAQAVLWYLRDKCQCDPTHITANALGENRPMANNQSQKGRYMNRRVEFIFSSPETNQ